MSDLSSVRQKVDEGAEWRGTIRVNIGDEEHELTVRQLNDGEFFEVMSMVDREELQSLREELPSDKMEELRDLQSADNLTDDERERLEELRTEMEAESGNMFDILSKETFDGIRLAGKYAVEPDDEDLREAFMDRAPEIEREYGVKVETPDDVREAIQDDINEMIERSTKLTSFTIGIQALVQTVGEDEGNSESLQSRDTAKKSSD